MNIYKDHTKLLDKKRELVQKMKNLSQSAQEASKAEKHNNNKNLAQNKNKA